MMEDKLLKLAKVVKRLKEQVLELSTKTDTIVKLEGPKGEKGDKGDKGEQGLQGLSGRDGRDGRDGKAGLNGTDGVGIAGVEVTFDNTLLVRLTDGTEIDAGEIHVEQTSNGQSSVLVQQYAGPQVYVQPTAPTSANPGDIWFDTSP
jgi:hypothetical protein